MKKIFKSAWVLIILFLLLFQVNSSQAETSSTIVPPPGVTPPGGNQTGAKYSWPETNLPSNPKGISGILKNFLSWLLGIFGMVALIAFIISGIQYLTAAGNDDQIKTAKRNATFSIVGVVVALAGFVIVQAIDAALKGTNSLF